MPPPSKAASRGRRDPSLLAGGQQDDEQAQAFEVGEQPDPDSQPDELDANAVYLYEGEGVRVRISIPVTLAGMERYSLVDCEAHADVQPDEDATLTAARCRDAVRKQFFLTMAEMEEDLAAYAEEQAARAALIARGTGRRD